MVAVDLSKIGTSFLRLQNTSSGAISSGDRAESASSRYIDQYLTISGDASWIALSDQVSRGVELTALVQIRNDALDELGALLVDMRALASSRDQGLDVATELDEKEREISVLIGANVLSLPKETVFISSDADPSDLLAVDEINYFGSLKVRDGLTDSIVDVASVEVDITEVAISHFTAGASHDPDSCPICGGSLRLNAEEVAAAPTSASTTSVGYTSSAASGTNYIDALNSTTKWDLTSGESLSYSYYDGTVAFDSTAYSGRETLIANATSIASHASDLDQAFQLWADSSGITFDKVTETDANNVGEIRVAYSTQMGTTTFGGQAAAFAFYPSSSALGGDSWFGAPSVISSNASFAVGGYGFVTAMHEFGHAIGISHPFIEGNGSASSPTGVTLSSDVENRRHTIMSYGQLKSYDRDLYISGVTTSNNGDGTYGVSFTYSTVQPVTPMV